MSRNAFRTAMIAAFCLGVAATPSCRKQDGSGPRTNDKVAPGGEVPTEAPGAVPAAAPTAGPDLGSPGDDALVPGEAPTQVTGANLTDLSFVNARARCDYSELGGLDYAVFCYAVAIQPDGSEVRALAVATELEVGWSDLSVVEGQAEAVSCTIAANQLSQSCRVRLAGGVGRAGMRASLSLKDVPTTRERKESFVVVLPYSVGVAAGLVPHLPFDYLGSAAPGAVPKVGETLLQGFQPAKVPADAAAFNALGDVCHKDGSTFIVTDGSVYRLTGGGLALFAGLAVKGEADGTHRFRLALSDEVFLACAAKDAIYVADRAAHRIYFVRETGAVEIVAGPEGWTVAAYRNPETLRSAPKGSTADGELARGALVYGPSALCVAADGALVFSESYNYRVRRIGADGRLTTIIGTGTRKDPEDGVPAATATTSSVSSLACLPDGKLVLSGTALRWIDADGIVRRINSDVRVGGADLAPVSDDSFLASGKGYVISMSIAGVSVPIIGSVGAPPASAGDGGPAATASVGDAFGIARTAAGELFVADNSFGKVRFVDAAGTISTVVGPSRDNCRVKQAAREARLQAPTAVAITTDGSILIEDRDDPAGLGHIKRLDAEGKEILRLDPCWPATSEDRGSAPEPPLMFDTDMVQGGGKTYLYSEEDEWIYLVDADGKRSEYFAPQTADDDLALKLALADPDDDDEVAAEDSDEDFDETASLAVDASGRVYFTTGSQIFRIDSVVPQLTKLIAGGDFIAYADATEGIKASGTEIHPTRIAISPDDTVFFTERQRNRIRKVTPDGKLYSVAGTGKRGSTGDGGDPLAAQITAPEDIEVGTDGVVYFVEVDPRGITGRVRTLTPGKDGVKIDTLFGRAPAAGDCGTGRIQGSAAAGEIDEAIRNSVSVICQGRPKAIAIAEDCSQAHGQKRIVIAQDFGFGFANIIDVKRTCKP